MSIQGRGMSVVLQPHQKSDFSLFYSPVTGFEASVFRQGRFYEILGNEISGLEDCLGKSVAAVQKYLSYTQFIVLPVTSNSGEKSLSLRFSLTLRGGGTNYSKAIKQSKSLESNFSEHAAENTVQRLRKACQDYKDDLPASAELAKTNLKYGESCLQKREFEKAIDLFKESQKHSSIEQSQEISQKLLLAYKELLIRAIENQDFVKADRHLKEINTLSPSESSQLRSELERKKKSWALGATIQLGANEGKIGYGFDGEKVFTNTPLQSTDTISEERISNTSAKFHLFRFESQEQNYKSFLAGLEVGQDACYAKFLIQLQERLLSKMSQEQTVVVVAHHLKMANVQKVRSYQLLPEAQSLWDKNRDEFYSRYGTHLIDSQTKGAVFLGAILINKLSEEGAETLRVSFDAQVSFGIEAQARLDATQKKINKIKGEVNDSIVQVFGPEGKWVSLASSIEGMIAEYRRFCCEVEKKEVGIISYGSSPYTNILLPLPI